MTHTHTPVDVLGAGVIWITNSPTRVSVSTKPHGNVAGNFDSYERPLRVVVCGGKRTAVGTRQVFYNPDTVRVDNHGAGNTSPLLTNVTQVVIDGGHLQGTQLPKYSGGAMSAHVLGAEATPAERAAFEKTIKDVGEKARVAGIVGAVLGAAIGAYFWPKSRAAHALGGVLLGSTVLGVGTSAILLKRAQDDGSWKAA